jgi:hypothetical protein
LKRSPGFAIISSAIILLSSYVLWEWYLSPGARVRRTLESAAAAAERADVEAFLSHFASDYSDFMHPDRTGFEAMVRESFARIERLNVTLKSFEVVVEGDQSRARLDAVVVAIRGEERYVVLGTPFEPEKLEVELSREKGRWKIRRVGRAGPVSGPVSK